MSKILFCPDLGCAYKWNDEYNQLDWHPLSKDNVLSGEEWGPVDEDIVGEEPVDYKGLVDVPLSTVYRNVEKILGVKK